MKILYCIYQLFVALPITILMTIWTAFTVRKWTMARPIRSMRTRMLSVL